MKKALAVMAFLAVIAASLGVSGVALAGTTVVGGVPTATKNNPMWYAYESTGGNSTFVLPAGGDAKVNRTLGIIPNTSSTLIVDIQILDGARFITGNLNPVGGKLTFANWTPVACTPTWTPLPGDFVSPTEFRYSITFPAVACTATGGVITWDPLLNSVLDVQDANNKLAGPGGGTVNVSMRILDPTNAGIEIDAGGNPKSYMVSEQTVFAKFVTANNATNTAVIDVAQARKQFELSTTRGDTRTNDRDGYLFLDVNDSWGDLDRRTGTAWFAGATDTGGFVTVTLNGDFTGVSSVVFDPLGANPYTFTVTGTAPNQTATLMLNQADTDGYSKWKVDPGTIASGLGTPIWIIVDGSTVLAERTITATATFTQGICSGLGNSGPGACLGGVVKTTAAAGVTFTRWTLNGTILFAPWLNGNNAVYNSRAYICAENSAAPNAPIDVRIFRVTATGTNVNAPIATFTTTYNMSQYGCINIKGYEDLLVAGGVVAAGTSYTQDNGNFAAEFVLRAINAKGVANVLNFVPVATPGGTGVGS